MLRIAVYFFLICVAYKASRILLRTWIATRDPQLVIILGSGRRASKAWRELRTRYHSTVKLLGFVDDQPISEMAPDVASRYLGTIEDLSDLLLRNVVDELLIAVPMKSCYDKAQHAVEIAEQVGVHVAFMRDMYTTTSIKRSVHREQELFNEFVPFHEHYVTRQAVKRVFDVIFSAIGLIVLSPLLLLVAVAIKLTSEGPVLFKQERYGYRRRIFHMYKFRSMVKNAADLMADLENQNEAAGPIFKIARDPRTTPLGRFLRASSLDELPQLWNVLIGQMSLVGPRPMSVRDVLLFSEATLMRRFTVKPGITGLWQVSGVLGWFRSMDQAGFQLYRSLVAGAGFHDPGADGKSGRETRWSSLGAEELGEVPNEDCSGPRLFHATWRRRKGGGRAVSDGAGVGCVRHGSAGAVHASGIERRGGAHVVDAEVAED